MNESVILFKYTSRSRPENFERGLKSIIDNLSQPDKAVILVSLDKDDARLPEYEELVKKYFDKTTIRVFTGISANKISAINRDLNSVKIDWDILVNMSDDMVFSSYGFDDIIRISFYKEDLFLHFNDGYQKDNVSTMSIMDRKYYDQFKYIYHPDYKSVWCDVEATDVAFALGCYKYMGDSLQIFEHLHPALGKAQYDEQYRASENLDVWGEDLKTIISRKLKGYGLLYYGANVKYTADQVRQWKIELNNARVNNKLEPITF